MKLFVVLFGSSKFYSSMMFLLTNLLRGIRWKQFFKHFLDAVGTLSAFATLIAFVGPWKSPEYSSFGCLILIGHCFNIIDLHLFSNSDYPFSHNSDATAITSDG